MLELVASGDIMIPVEKGASAALRSRIVVNEGIRAPICAGDRLGSLELYDGDKLLAVKPLVANEDVDAAALGFYLNKLFGRWTA